MTATGLGTVSLWDIVLNKKEKINMKNILIDILNAKNRTENQKNF